MKTKKKIISYFVLLSTCNLSLVVYDILQFLEYI